MSISSLVIGENCSAITTKVDDSMIRQASLFDEEPRYCIDTNVIVSFLRGTDDEFYGSDVFAPQWLFIEELATKGAIVAPREVERELTGWARTIEGMAQWVRSHKGLFLAVEASAQLVAAKEIVNAYPAYASSTNYVGDLSIMSLAKYLGVAVLTLERRADHHAEKRPKIPNVCQEFGIDCVSVSGFLRREGFGAR
jgi:hypothetical protein